MYINNDNTNQHESMTDYHHFVGLYEFLYKELGHLKIRFFAYISSSTDKLGIVWFG